MDAHSDLASKRVIVMGLGRFGGGVGAASWLCRQGADVVVTDLADEESLKRSLAELRDFDISYRLGEHSEKDLAGADLLVVNPAVNKAASAFVQAAIARRIPLTSEMNLFLQHCRCRVIGITGSLGKSTTTAMLFDVLDARCDQLAGNPRRVWIGGNIGVSLLCDLDDIAGEDIVVLELSSFQLQDLSLLGRSLHGAVLLNVHPTHLERHGDFTSYLKAKTKIFAHQKAGDFAVISEQALVSLREHGLEPPRANVHIFERAHALAGELHTPGAHQLDNAAAVLVVGRILGLHDDAIVEELKRFKGLDHRLEWVREYGGVNYVNDSKSTTPQATIAALAALADKVVLVVGGSDKPTSYEALAESMCQQARAVICFGQARAKLAAALRRLSKSHTVPLIKTVHEFNGGINLARRLARQGETVLFSPGCPSHDEFVNFEARGEQFKAVVHGWV